MLSNIIYTTDENGLVKYLDIPLKSDKLNDYKVYQYSSISENSEGVIMGILISGYIGNTVEKNYIRKIYLQ